MRRRAHRPVQPRVPWVALPLLVALVLGIALFPGRWTNDTVSEYYQVRTGHLDDWYGTTFLASLRLGYLLVPHFGLVLVTQLTLLAVGGFGVCRAIFRPSTSALVTTLMLLLPTTLGWGIVLSRDVWYGVLLLIGAAALRLVLFDEPARATRLGAAAVASLSLILLAGVRQNGVIGAAPLVAFATWRLLAPRTSSTALSRRRWRIPAVGVVTAAAMALVLVGMRLVTYDVLHASRTHVEEALYIYDLSAASQRTGVNLFPRRRVPSSRFRALRTTFDPNNIDSVLWGKGAFFSVDDFATAPSLKPAWTRLLTHRPLDYLGVRARLFSRLIGAAPDDPVWTYQPRTDSSQLAGEAFDEPNRIVDGYLDAFRSSPLQRPLIYLASIFAFVLASVRLESRYRFVAAVGLAAVFNELSFFFLATVVGNRFSWVVMAVGVITAAGIVQIVGSRFRERRGRWSEARRGRPHHHEAHFRT